MMYLLGFYFACQLFLMCSFIYMYKEGAINFAKEDFTMMSLCMVFSPIGVLAFLSVFLFQNWQQKQRISCQRIKHKWENAARKDLKHDDTWSWYSDPTKAELRHNRLRETVGCLTDKELHLLVTVGKETYELEKAIREAVMDEIIHREIEKA